MQPSKIMHIKRHMLMVRIIHWANAFCFVSLLISALALLGIKNYEVNYWGYFYSMTFLWHGNLHDYLIIPYLLLFLPHLYLALIAYPITFIGMITGYVPKEYAQKRHQKWYQDKVG